MAVLDNRVILVLMPFQLIAAIALFSAGIVAIKDETYGLSLVWITYLAFPIWSGLLVLLSVILGAYASHTSNVHPRQAFVCLMVYRAVNITLSLLCFIMMFGYAAMIPNPDRDLPDNKAVVVAKVLFSFALVELFLSVLANVAAQYRGSPRTYTQLLDGATSEMYMQGPVPPQVPMAQFSGGYFGRPTQTSQPVYQTQGPQMQPMLINQGSMQAAQPAGAAAMMVPAYVPQTAGVQGPQVVMVPVQSMQQVPAASEGGLVYAPTSAPAFGGNNIAQDEPLIRA